MAALTAAVSHLSKNWLTMTAMESNVAQVNPRRVSNSEVSAWNLCERKYFYEYDLNLEPVKPSEALSRGVLGHEVLAVYYTHVMAGVAHAEAVRLARGVLHEALAETGDLELITDLDRILQGYWDYYGDESAKYKVLRVEQDYDVPLTSEATYVMRLDVLMKNLVTGDTELWDHKFVYDFWNSDKINLSGQFPKYTGALRFTGQDVDKCVLNQLRYRKMKAPAPTDLYKRTTETPSTQKIKRALREQIGATQEILTWRTQPIEQRQEVARRVLNPTVCGYCSFKNLCMAEFDGNDLRFLTQSEYRTKTKYGYNSEDI